jgi:hypothetical protein
MATLKLNNTTVFTESNGAASIPSAVKFPAGHVVQVVQVIKSSTFTANVDNWSQYIIGLEPSIVLKQNNSKILVQTTQHWTSAYGGAEGGGIRLYRNGTEVVGTRDTSISWSAWFNWNGDVSGPGSADPYAPGNYSASFLDSPEESAGTTLNYKFYVNVYGSSYPNLLNIGSTYDSDTNGRWRPSSTALLMEISNG